MDFDSAISQACSIHGIEEMKDVQRVCLNICVYVCAECGLVPKDVSREHYFSVTRACRQATPPDYRSCAQNSAEPKTLANTGSAVEIGSPFDTNWQTGWFKCKNKGVV